jgi:uncharacterized membrane protein
MIAFVHAKPRVDNSKSIPAAIVTVASLYNEHYVIKWTVHRRLDTILDRLIVEFLLVVVVCWWRWRFCVCVVYGENGENHPCGYKKNICHIISGLKDKIARPMEYLKVVCLPT